MIHDIRCGTCRYLETAPSMDPGHPMLCAFPLPQDLPYWVRYALDDADEDVGPEDGANCDAWERKA